MEFAGIYRFFPPAGKRERAGTGVSLLLPPGRLVFLRRQRQGSLRGISVVSRSRRLRNRDLRLGDMAMKASSDAEPLSPDLSGPASAILVALAGAAIVAAGLLLLGA
jgi:hypothetical protein